MPNYIQDPNNSKKQIPGPPTDQHFDKHQLPQTASFIKRPHYVIVNANQQVAFFFESSASFSTKATSEGSGVGLSNGTLTGSQHYVDFGTPAVGTKFDINPCAWSGSSTQTVTFVYKGGLDGQGRP